MQVVGARMGYAPKDSGWHNLAFIGTISRRRLQSDARILWLDWENNCRSAPYPSRKSLNDVVKRMVGSIGGVLSGSSRGAQLTKLLRGDALARWLEIPDHVLFCNSPFDPWLKSFGDMLFAKLKEGMDLHTAPVRTLKSLPPLHLPPAPAKQVAPEASRPAEPAKQGALPSSSSAAGMDAGPPAKEAFEEPAAEKTEPSSCVSTTMWSQLLDSRRNRTAESPFDTPHDNASTRVVHELLDSYTHTEKRGGRAMKRIKGDGVEKNSKGEGHSEYPQWVGDLVALFLASFHRALQPYALDRARPDAKQADGTYDYPRTIRFANRFVQQRHKGAILALKKQAMAASADEHSWILEGGWVDVHLVRRVAYDMILPFRWSWGWPRGNWSWTSVWLLDVEADMILSQAMSGFISAEPDDIIEAARIWKLDADAAPAGDDK